MKGLKVNVKRANFMYSRHDAPKTKVKSGKFPCTVCLAGAGIYSILHTSCKIGYIKSVQA